MDSCKLCDGKLDEANVEWRGPLNSLCQVRCSRCGVYIITRQAVETDPDPSVKKHRHLISAVARWKSERGSTLRVEEKLLVDRSEFEAQILSECPRNTQAKLDHILMYIAEKESYPTEDIFIDVDKIASLFYC